MMEIERIRKILKKGLGLSSAGQTEILAIARKSGSTRFSNSAIHQNMAEENVRLSVRVIKDKRIGSASSNRLDDDSVKETVTKACQIAPFLPPHPDFKSLPGPAPLPSLQTYYQKTAGITPADRAGLVSSLIKKAAAHGLNAAGSLSTEETVVSVVNSLGIDAAQEFTGVDVSTVVMSEDSSGYAAFSSYDIASLDIDHLATKAVSKALLSRKPVALEPGKYTVILEPLAIGELLGFLGYAGFGALAFQEGRSFMTGQIGERIAGDNITIWDDGLDQRTTGMPFDFEGVPKEKVMLIENGIACGVVYDSMTAFKEDKHSTGHALPAPNLAGPLPLNLFLKSGNHSLEEMITSTGKGVLVTRFHYTNLEDPLKTVLTGMTRDGTFLIENGKIKYGVKNLRFTQSVLEALSSVEQVSRQAELVPSPLGACYVPALKIKDFHFTGVTEF